MGQFITALANEAAGATTSLIGTGMGMALAGWQDRRQLRQQQKLQNLQLQGNKQMADYNQALQYDMWQKTGPVGQMEQLEKAGLNPGLIYGMGGAGGQTTGSPSGAISGSQANNSDPTGMGLMMLQAKMQEAQIKVAEAQAKNIDADTDNKKGIERDLAKTVS